MNLIIIIIIIVNNNNNKEDKFHEWNMTIIFNVVNHRSNSIMKWRIITKKGKIDGFVLNFQKHHWKSVESEDLNA